MKGQEAVQRTELPLGAHVSGTAPVHSSRVMEAMDSSDLMLAHASSMALSTCTGATLHENGLPLAPRSTRVDAHDGGLLQGRLYAMQVGTCLASVAGHRHVQG